MRVFIENEAASKQKHLYDEKTLVYQRTMEVARAYPYPYGFILGTTAEDGDNVDVFVLTTKVLKSGELVNCMPIGLMEQFERSWDENKRDAIEMDHNVLAVLEEEPDFVLTETMKTTLRGFVTHVFDRVEKDKTQVGRFLGKTAAENYIAAHRDGK